MNYVVYSLLDIEVCEQHVYYTNKKQNRRCKRPVKIVHFNPGIKNYPPIQIYLH